MAQPLDIFRLVPEGVRWIGSAENLEAAKALIKAAAGEQPGDFLVVSLETGWNNGNQGSGNRRLKVASARE